MTSPVILWFRRNLRLRDNAVLNAAVETGQPIIPLYVSDSLDTGGASRWWLHHSLQALDKALRDIGSHLLVSAGSPSELIPDIIRQSGASALLFARRYEPQCRADEQALEVRLGDEIDIQAFDDSLFRHPVALLTKGQTPFKVFTPFWRAATALGEPAVPEPRPARIRFARHSLESIPLADLELLPTKPDWATGWRKRWTPGEEGALARLDQIEPVAQVYADQRDRPDLDTTSRLSPHLHFGEVSVRQAWHSVRNAQAHLPTATGAEALLRQLYWREFSAYLLYHFPRLPSAPLRDEFDVFPWVDNEEQLAAWQQGKTGYPIVDAGMRQLWATGWMHNRVRMIAASFLVKDLLIPWQRGADWFLDTLVDADLANNSAGWQWVSGCGTDAAPYFRIFNPTLQGQKFDPGANYIRRWIPELESGEYPAPMIDHATARAAALEAYRRIRASR